MIMCLTVCVCPSFILQTPVTFLACITIGFYYKQQSRFSAGLNWYCFSEASEQILTSMGLRRFISPEDFPTVWKYILL